MIDQTGPLHQTRAQAGATRARAPTDPLLITHCRLPLRFDPARLLADLRSAERQPWIGHYVTQNYRGDWSALPLRALGGEDNIYAHPGPPDQYRDTAALQHCPYFQEVLASFRAPLGAVRLMKLGPGSEILEHTDPGCGYEYGELRLHLPITTNPGVAFFLDGHRVSMQPGECWYLNFDLPHRAHNAGDSERVHLVIDCRLEPWLDGLFRGLGFGALERYGTQVRFLDDNIAGLRRVDSPQARAALAQLLAQKDEIESARRERIALRPAME